MIRFVQWVRATGYRRAWQIASLCRRHVKAHPNCWWCGRSVRPEAHHIKSVHQFPMLALDPLNLRTLCGRGRCHFVVGHLCDWKRSVVVEDATIINLEQVLTTNKRGKK